MKKIVLLLATIALIVGLFTSVYADETVDIPAEEVTQDILLIAPAPVASEIRVLQNNEFIDFKDSEGNVVNPQIINDRTMVPFRKIFNSLGVTDENIIWNDETKTVIAKKDNIEIELQIDNTTAKKTVSGEQTEITLDSAPVIVDGRTMVPVRFIAESMDKKVAWDADSRTVIILDTEELVNDLINSIPKFMELVKEEASMPKTYATNTEISGNVEYASTNDKENNSKLGITGTIKSNLAEDAISIDINLKADGEGLLYDSLKESNTTEITANIIIKDGKTYIKSTLIDAQTGGKWIMQEDASLKNINTLTDRENFDLKQMFEIDEELITVDTYKTLEVSVKLLKALLKDENIEVIEKGSEKTYTINMKVSDIKEALKDLMSAEELVGIDALDGNIKVTEVVKDGKIQSTGCDMEFKYSVEAESLKITLTTAGKVGESTTVTVPADSEVIDSAEAINAVSLN